MKTYQVHQLLKAGQEQLDKKGIGTVDARLLLEYVMKTDFTTLLSKYNEDVQEEVVSSYMTLLKQRMKGVPLQYITHEQYFMGNKFYVNESVLIPRPETEILVELCLAKIEEMIHQGKRALRILDMCTGSGCILISLVKEVSSKFPELDMEWLGVDIQDGALFVSKKNEEVLLDKPVIQWVKSDLFSHIESGMEYDLIVSNPPYIPRNDLEGLMNEVKDYEPIIALDGGDDGLIFYRQIIQDSYARLKNGGGLFFEIGHGQMQDIKKLMESRGFSDIQEVNDMAGLERIISGTKN